MHKCALRFEDHRARDPCADRPCQKRRKAGFSRLLSLFVSIWGFDVGSVMHVPMTFLKELLNLLLVLHVFVVAVYMHSLSLAPWLSNFVFHQFQHLLCLHSPIARNAASESASRRLLRLLFVVAERGYLDLG